MLGDSVVDLSKPRRSALFVPGSNPRAIDKARHLPADVVILDLEDAVAPDQKREARDRAVAACEAKAFVGRDTVVRINGIGTIWHADDLATISVAAPSAILIPKITSAGDIDAVLASLRRLRVGESLKIWAMLETPAAILRAEQIAASSHQLEVLVIGTNDLAHDLRVSVDTGRQPLWLALQQVVLAARAAGKGVLDGVFNDISNLPGFEAECVEGRNFGFDGKTLIHPTQIDICNQVFAPSDAQLANAQRIVRAFEVATQQGQNIVVQDGRMIEPLHVDSARRLIELAASIARRASDHSHFRNASGG